MTQDFFDPARGLLDRRVYSDGAVFRSEQQRIFQRCWVAVGHEAQLPRPGDFILSRMAGAMIAIWRGIDGEIRLFRNSCPISGARLFFAEMGNIASIDCSCHGIDFGSDGNAPDGSVQLTAVRRTESYHGLLFATQDDEAESLDAYLGDFSFYLDSLLVGREVLSVPMKGVVASNWKLPMDAFFAGLAVESAVMRFEPEPLENLIQVSAGPGGLTGTWGDDGTFQPIRGALFPTLAISWVESGFHILQPRGPMEVEVWSFWLSSPSEAPEENTRRRLAFQRNFAVSAPAFDDVAIHWQEITRLSTTFAARAQPVLLDAELGEERYHEDLPGLIAGPSSEMNQRAFYQRWQDLLKQPPR